MRSRWRGVSSDSNGKGSASGREEDEEKSAQGAREMETTGSLHEDEQENWMTEIASEKPKANAWLMGMHGVCWWVCMHVGCT
jgi:hypothetical protein